MKLKNLMSAAVAAIAVCSSGSSTVQAKTVTLGNGHTPSVSSDGRGHVFVVFEGQNPRNGDADIFYSFSDDGGKTWSPRQDVSPTTGVSTRPRVAVEKNGAIDVVWNDTTRDENNPDIFFTRSTDSGRSWTVPLNITNTPGMTRDPEIAIGPDNVIHVVFSDTLSGIYTRDIMYTSSADGGKTWSKEKQLENISNTESDSSEPSIAIAQDGGVHVSWKEENSSPASKPQVFYSQRSQNVWAKPLRVSNGERYAYHPVVSCGTPGQVFVDWSERANPEGAADVLCAILTGSTLTSVQPTLVAKTGLIASAATMAANSSRVAVAWPDRALGEMAPRIRLRVLSHQLTGSPHERKISGTSGMQMSPTVTIDGNTLVVVWEERKLNSNPVRVKSFDLTK